MHRVAGSSQAASPSGPPRSRRPRICRRRASRRRGAWSLTDAACLRLCPRCLPGSSADPTVRHDLSRPPRSGRIARNSQRPKQRRLHRALGPVSWMLCAQAAAPAECSRRGRVDYRSRPLRRGKRSWGRKEPVRAERSHGDRQRDPFPDELFQLRASEIRILSAMEIEHLLEQLGDGGTVGFLGPAYGHVHVSHTTTGLVRMRQERTPSVLPPSEEGIGGSSLSVKKR